MTRAAKITALKNQLRNFLRDENHLYGIILVHLTSNVALQTRKHLLAAGYRIFFKSSKLNFVSLTDHSHKPRAQTKQRMVTILRHNNKLTGGMCLLGFRRVCALSFLLSSIRLLFFFIQQNHTEALIFHINTFFKPPASHTDCGLYIANRTVTCDQYTVTCDKGF